MGYAPLSVDMPLTRQIEMASVAGKMFYVTTSAYSVTAGGAWAGLSVFFAARATKIILISAKGWDKTGANASMLRKTTTDPNFSGKTISGPAITNSLGSGGAATTGGTLTSATEGISSATGTLHRATYLSNNSALGSGEILLKPSDYIIIPPNVAGGFLLITNGASADVVAQELVWVELS